MSEMTTSLLSKPCLTVGTRVAGWEAKSRWRGLRDGGEKHFDHTGNVRLAFGGREIHLEAFKKFLQGFTRGADFKTLLSPQVMTTSDWSTSSVLSCVHGALMSAADPLFSGQEIEIVSLAGSTSPGVETAARISAPPSQPISADDADMLRDRHVASVLESFV